MRLYIIRHGDPDYELDDLTEAGLATARCIGLSDLSHLRIAGLAPNASGLKANLG
jgi:hypothetical protein